MKTLSIRQPWAELIVQGRKTLELRTWTVKYRGPLAIHASQTVEREACLAHGLDPDQVTTGAVIGVAALVEIVELDAASFAARRTEHLDDGPWTDSPLYGWRLANPRTLPEPELARGRMGLFETPIAGSEILEVKSQAEIGSPLQADSVRRPGSLVQLAAQSATRPGAQGQTAHPFELRVLPVAATAPGEPAYRLALHQRAVEAPPEQRGLYKAGREATRRVVELGGSTLRAVADHVMEALRTNGYKPTELGVGRSEPFDLAEETGVRLGLLFLAVRPITKVERVEVIGQGIRAMTSEEAYYWYSKCTSGPTAERAQRALRVLLAAE